MRSTFLLAVQALFLSLAAYSNASAFQPETVANALRKLSNPKIHSHQHVATRRRRLESNTAQNITLLIQFPSSQLIGDTATASWTGFSGSVTLKLFKSGNQAGPFLLDTTASGGTTTFTLPSIAMGYDMQLTASDGRTVTTSFVVQLKVQAPSLVPIGGPLTIEFWGAAATVDYYAYLFAPGASTPLFLTPPGSPAVSPLTLPSFNSSWTGPFTLLVSGGDTYGYASVCIANSLAECSAASSPPPGCPFSAPASINPCNDATCMSDPMGLPCMLVQRAYCDGAGASDSFCAATCPFTSPTNNPCSAPACLTNATGATCMSIQMAYCSSPEGQADTGCGASPPPSSPSGPSPGGPGMYPVQLYFPEGAMPGKPVTISWQMAITGNVSITVHVPDGNGPHGSIAVPVTPATDGAAMTYNWTVTADAPAGDYRIVVAQGSNSLSSETFFLSMPAWLQPSSLLQPGAASGVLQWSSGPPGAMYVVTAFKSSMMGPSTPMQLHNGTVSSPFAFSLPPSMHGSGYFLISAADGSSSVLGRPIHGYAGFCIASIFDECNFGYSTSNTTTWPLPGTSTSGGLSFTVSAPSTKLAPFTPLSFSYSPASFNAHLDLVNAVTGAVAAPLGQFSGGMGKAAIPPSVPAGRYAFQLTLPAIGAVPFKTPAWELVLPVQAMAGGSGATKPLLHNMFSNPAMGGSVSVSWPAVANASYDVEIVGEHGTTVRARNVRGGGVSVALPPTMKGHAVVAVTQTLMPMSAGPSGGALALLGQGMTFICIGDAKYCFTSSPPPPPPGSSSKPLSLEVHSQSQHPAGISRATGHESPLDSGSLPGTVLNITWQYKGMPSPPVDLYVIDADTHARVITIAMGVTGKNLTWAIPMDTAAGRYRIQAVLPDGTTAESSAGQVYMYTKLEQAQAMPGAPLTITLKGAPPPGPSLNPAGNPLNTVYTAVVDTALGQRWIISPASLAAAGANGGMVMTTVPPQLLSGTRARLSVTAEVMGTGSGPQGVIATYSTVFYFCIGSCPAPPAAPTTPSPPGPPTNSGGSCLPRSAALKACRAARGGFAWTCDSPRMKRMPCPAGSVFSYEQDPPRCVPNCSGGDSSSPGPGMM